MRFKRKLLWSLFCLYCVFYMLLYIAYHYIINILHSSFSLVSVPAIVLPFVMLLLFQLVLWIYTNSSNEGKGKTRFIVISTIGFLPVLYCAVILGINEYKANFTLERWMNHPAERVYMVDDFLKSYELTDKTTDEVITLLGPPTKGAYFKEDNNIVYYLGDERGIISIDSEWLVILFNKSGKVMKYDIKRD